MLVRGNTLAPRTNSHPAVFNRVMSLALPTYEYTAEQHARMERLGLEPGDCYFTPEGYIVFTAQYHLKRGYCCQSGCRHCPYGFNAKKKMDRG